MASIERTAYPRFKRYYTANELDKIYTPTRIEIAFALKVTTGEENYFNLLVLLKVFQRLGYFPQITDIPLTIINHIRTVLDLQEDRSFSYQYPSTLSRHKKAIRSYLQVSPFNQKGKALITAVITESALRMDNPADLINVAIEEVVKERYELPGFNTLDRLVNHLRKEVNQQIFSQVISQLNPEYIQRLKDLLDNYGDLVANAVIFHNVVDLTEVLLQLKKEGFFWEREDLAALSPYLTSHIKRFGDYLIDLDAIPPAFEETLNLGF